MAVFVTRARQFPKQIGTLHKQARTFTSGQASQYTDLARILVRNFRHVEQILLEVW